VLWSQLFTHMFLDLFSEGWFVLAALHPWARRSGELLVAGLPVVFLLYLPVGLVPPVARWAAAAGGLMVVIGTLGNVRALWPVVGRGWRVPLAFLALKAVTQLGLLAPAAAQWAEAVRLRVPYLHWLLLGFTTLTLFAAAERLWGIPGRRVMTTAVVVVLLTLLPLTGLWPPVLGGLWTLHAAAWAAVGPVVVAAAILIRSRDTKYERRETGSEPSELLHS
jgi:hypothetical protein